MRIWGGIHTHHDGIKAASTEPLHLVYYEDLRRYSQSSRIKPASPLCLVFYEDLRQYSHSSRWNYISTVRTLEYGLLWGSGALFTHIIMKLKQHALLELCIWFIKRIWGGIYNHLQPGVSTILYTRTVQFQYCNYCIHSEISPVMFHCQQRMARLKKLKKARTFLLPISFKIAYLRFTARIFRKFIK